MTNDESTQKNHQDIQNELSWTSEELQKLRDAGHIPIELFESSRSEELNHYLKFNREILKEHCYPNYDKNPYAAIVPPQNEWPNAPDLQIIDRRTGQVVQVLEMARDIELCEGVYLKIKAKDFQEWEKETAEAKKLTKEQSKDLKTFLDKFGKDRPLTRKEITTAIEEIRKPQKNKTFRQSRELIDNKLDRKIENEQLTIFDIYDKNNKKIEEIEKPIIKGLDLDQGEDRIVHTLTLLLSRKSENTDQSSKDYYMGNHTKGITSINDIDMETARILVSPHEFYSTYYGREDYNTDHIKFVLNKLDSLSKKMFLTTWNFPIKGKEKRYNKFRTYCPLFNAAILNLDLSESECQEIDNNKDLLEGKGCQFLFKFQPQFTNNIRERYVEFPEDIYSRISEAIGKDRYGQYINLMRDFLFREKQHKRYDFVRDKSTLIETLRLDKFWKEGRKKMVNGKISECVDVFKKLGLLIECEPTLGKLCQDQYRIRINPDFK